MLRITVTKEGGSPQVSTFDKREISVGRTTANDLVIAEPGVSSHHARILFTGDGVTLIDLESTNGTFVNGERIRGPALVQPGDEVYICAYHLDFDFGGASSQPAPASMDGPPPMIGQPPSGGPPPMVGQPSPPGPEYPTPAELGPPPLSGSIAPDGPPPVVGVGEPDGPPPMLDGPPLLEPPAPVATPSPEPPPPAVEAMPPVEAPSPIEAPPPLAPPASIGSPTPSPPEDLPPPLTPPAAASPSDAAKSPAAVSGQIAPSESPPPAVAPTPPPDVSPAEPSIAPAAVPSAPAEPTPTPSSLVAPLAPPPAPAPAPLPSPVLAAPAAVLPVPPSDDLSDLKSPGDGPRACSRVFALVRYHLAPDGSLPPRDATARAKARSEAQRLFADVAERVPEIQARPWANRLANELCGLGAVRAPLADTSVRSVFVHGPGRVLVLRNDEETPGRADAEFSCPEAVELVVRRLTGRPFDADHPLVDARSTEGADVRAVHGSLTDPGPLVTIHRARAHAEARGLEELVQQRALPSGMATLLCHCMQAGLNVLVCGGPGARVFPWLAALAAEAPAEQRQVVVRPGPEPEPLPPNAVVIHADAMPTGASGGPGPAQRAMRAALALAPDRLVAHDVTGSEAADVVAAMGRSMRGTLASVRASSADAGLSRLTALSGLGGDAPDAAARARDVAQAVDVVLAVSRFADGATRVTQLAEPTVSSAGTAQATELVTYQARTGQWTATGVAPSFFAVLQRGGFAVDVGLLSE